jgi:GTP-binding protein HflX
VLREIGADAVPGKLLLNKVDRLDAGAREALESAHPDAILLSAKNAADVQALRRTLIEFFEHAMIDEDLVVPYDKQRLVSEIHEEARVLSEEYDEQGARLRVRALPETLARLRHAVSS